MSSLRTVIGLLGVCVMAVGNVHGFVTNSSHIIVVLV